MANEYNNIENNVIGKKMKCRIIMSEWIMKVTNGENNEMVNNNNRVSNNESPVMKMCRIIRMIMAENK